MNILLSSHTFHPNLGGLEMVSMLLAREFVRSGNAVIVITRTPGDGADAVLPFAVKRRPTVRQLLRLTRWADVVFHNNISLRVAWPLLLIRRPWIVAHQTWLPHGTNLRGVKGAAKRLTLRKAVSIAISKSISVALPTPCEVIPNPYDDKTFRLLPGVTRDRDLVFVGRFVSDKGLPDLLQALQQLKDSGLTPRLTVIGSGPMESLWQDKVSQLQLENQVHFIGVKRGKELAEELNRHLVLVVPSRWNEPFGIVALEGMACGCLVVGSEAGGLKDAIGPAGLTFPNGDPAALAAALERVLGDEDLRARCLAAAAGHLDKHRPAAVAAAYQQVFEASAYGRLPDPSGWDT